MKVFIDLGTYNGNVMKIACKKFKDFDLFIGFEPMPDLYKEVKKRFAKRSKVKIYDKAVGIKNEKSKLYVHWAFKGGRKFIGKGSTLLSGKTSGGLNEDVYVMVDVIDFAEYLSTNYTKDDYIVVKMDIEGEEYDLLKHLIDTGAIQYIDELYCEWHYHKMSASDITKERHDETVNKLNEMGFKLTGDNMKDEFSKRF